jgi:hypothetical protein
MEEPRMQEKNSTIEKYLEIYRKLDLPILLIEQTTIGKKSGKRPIEKEWQNVKKEYLWSLIDKKAQSKKNIENVGIRCDSFAVIDIDDPIKTEIILSGIDIPETAICYRSSQSTEEIRKFAAKGHLYFKRPSWLEKSIKISERNEETNKSETIVEIRTGTGFQCVTAPSIHYSGDQYLWHNIELLENLPELPKIIFDRIVNFSQVDEIENKSIGTWKRRENKEEFNRQILEVLKQTPGCCNSHEEWVKLMYAFKSAGFSYDEVDSVFAGSSGYDAKKNRYSYEKARPNSRDKSATMGSAYYIAQKYNPELTKELLGKSKKERATVEDIRFEEENDSTFIIKVINDNGEMQEVREEFCNFTMRFLEKRANHEKKISWLANAESRKDQKEIVIDQGEKLTNPSKFADLLGQNGMFCINNVNHSKRMEHNQFLLFVEKQSTEMKNVSVVQSLGSGNNKMFLFGNKVAHPNEIKDLEFIVPPKTKMRYKEPEKNRIEYWKETADLFNSLYLTETWKILGFAAASIFHKEVEEEFGFFPILFIGGQKGKGKSQLAHRITALFGAHRELKPLNVDSTTKSVWRDAEKYRGIPITLNEYSGSGKYNSLISQLYDREGYSRAKMTNDLETHKTEVNATFIIISTRNISGYEAEAVVSRLVSVDSEKFAQDEKVFYEIQKRIEYLASFVPIALSIDTKSVIANIEKEAIKYQQEHKAEFRIAKNYAIIKCFYDAFIEKLYANEEEVEQLAKILSENEIGKDISETQLNVINENYATRFISLLIAEMKRDSSNISDEMAKIEKETGMLSFHLPNCIPFIKKMAGGEDIPSGRTLGKLLRSIGAQKDQSKSLDGTNRKVWTISLKSIRDNDSE